MKYETILYDKDGKVAIVTLNRPKAYNAMNAKMFSELSQAFDEIDRDDDVHAAVITGKEKFFAAGADISEVGKLETPMDAYRFFKDVDIFQKVEDLDKPVIAAVSGLALGGGCELCLACDFRIAATNAVFGQPEIKIGVIPGRGGTQRLPRLIGTAKAKELLYTGNSIDAMEAYRLGLVNKVVSIESLMAETMRIASEIAAQPCVALRATKLAVNGGIHMDIISATAYESRCFEIVFSSADQKEGMTAFIEKRKPLFRNQ